MSPSKQKNIIILILGGLYTISPFAIDMYLPAFPEITKALHTATPQLSFSLASYFIGLAVGQILYGPLLDRFGRKLPLYAGLILFIVASLLCASSTTVEWLIAMRFVQALGGCAAQVAAMAMVRDFFPVEETARIISLLILILGVSPLLAPTVGSFVSEYMGWKWVFFILATFVAFMLAATRLYLPPGHPPDPAVSLQPAPILRNFAAVLTQPQFITYALAGAVAFSGLLVYVTSSPIIFLEVFHLTARQFGYVFAALAVGFIGSNQVNVWLLKKFTSQQIFSASLLFECPISLLFLIGTRQGWFGLGMTLVFLFIILSVLGLAYPNAAALALTPFETNIGSASAMLGFLQIGVSSLASASIGIFKSHDLRPVTIIIAATSWIGLAIFLFGKRFIPQLKFVPEKGVTPIGH